MIKAKQVEIAVSNEGLKLNSIQLQKKKSNSGWMKKVHFDPLIPEEQADAQRNSEDNKDSEDQQWVVVLEKSMSTRLFTIKEHVNPFDEVTKLAGTSRI